MFVLTYEVKIFVMEKLLTKLKFRVIDSTDWPYDEDAKKWLSLFMKNWDIFIWKYSFLITPLNMIIRLIISS